MQKAADLTEYNVYYTNVKEQKRCLVSPEVVGLPRTKIILGYDFGVFTLLKMFINAQCPT